MKLSTVCTTMEDFKGSNFDCAICVFTVLLYMLDEESLNRAFSAAYSALKSDGILLIDIPYKAVFHSYSMSDELIERDVSVIPDRGNIYNYQEALKVNETSGDESTYTDEFQIRYWPPGYVRNTLKGNGFILEADLTNHFSGSGSHYWIMKKSD